MVQVYLLFAFLWDIKEEEIMNALEKRNIKGLEQRLLIDVYG